VCQSKVHTLRRKEKNERSRGEKKMAEGGTGGILGKNPSLGVQSKKRR